MDHSRIAQEEDPSRVRAFQQTIRAIEDRFSTLQKHLDKNGLMGTCFRETADLIMQTQSLYQVLEDERDRRDLSFSTHRRLSALADWCRWMVRKLADECFLRVRLDLEQKLKAMLSAGALELYLRIDELGDMAKEIVELSDADLGSQMRQEQLAGVLVDRLNAFATFRGADDDTGSTLGSAAILKRY